MAAAQGDTSVLLQSTTSTQNSGLYAAILPVFEGATGIEVRVVAVGTGQALKNAQNCDGDIVLVHAREAEDRFVDAGYGAARYDVMENDFVLVGPESDPAGVAGMSVREAMSALAASESVFVSRGDDSGTHRKEIELWRNAQRVPDGRRDAWYREAGAGMGATLNIAVGMDGYALTDRATWMTFANKSNHDIAVEGGNLLRNAYGIIPVSPDHCPDNNHAGADAFLNWITGAEGQAAIAGYRPNGIQLFFPTARANN